MKEDRPREIVNLYKDINLRMLDCIKKDSIPYLQENPLPQDMNVVNGRHFGDINKIQLELKAAQIGAKSLKWIYKADADFIGLKLKDGIDTEPITVYANVNRDGISTKTESQPVYLMDQFNENSIKLALEITRSEGTSEKENQKIGIARNIIRNIAEYDAGANEFNLRENKRKNIKTNLKEPEILKQVSAAHNNVTQYYNDSQKLIFKTLNNYFIRQETGLALSKPLTSEEKEQFKRAIAETANIDSPRLTQTLTECFLYSERLTHFGFSPERVYVQEDLNKNLTVLAPAASQFEPKKTPLLERDKEQEKNREREHEIKPRHISHQRGL